MNASKTLSVLRVVAIASRSGAYGGPFDTASRQTQMACDLGLSGTLIAGAFINDEPKNSKETFDKCYITVRRRLVHQGFSTVFSIGILRALWKQIGKSDVVHVSFSRELIPIMASTLTILRKKRLVIQPHGMLTSRQSAIHRVADIITKPIYRRANVVIALTEREKQELQAWEKNSNFSYIVLGNPVPVHQKAIQRTIKSDPTVAFIARLHPRKNVKSFIAAADMLGQNGPRFLVVGPDGGEIELVKEASRRPNRLEYFGAVSQVQVQEILDDVDVFVLTSANEPWGNVLATAISMGIPVIVSSSSALAGDIERHKAGLAYPDGEDERLVRSIQGITSNSDQYAQYSRNALELSRKLLSRAEQMDALRRIYMGTSWQPERKSRNSGR